jgi:glycosyltransferase involved in cell wall biosynthesis
MSSKRELEISIVIPTYGREEVLIQTIASLLPLKGDDGEILVVDQTVIHQAESLHKLRRLSQSREIEWLKCARPSVTAAMNQGLLNARGRIVLFLDDDIEPDSDLVEAHLAGHCQPKIKIVAGKVIQPWYQDESAPFFANQPMQVKEFMGCNFSVDRAFAISLGGFDQNFRFAAYQFERDFADRVRAAGGLILYWPDAVIKHLKTAEGGVRSYGEHLTTWRPGHSLGAYYYIQKSGGRRLRRTLKRLTGSVFTRFHLTHPWFVPFTLVAEISGMVLARMLWRKGPQLITKKFES